MNVYNNSILLSVIVKVNFTSGGVVFFYSHFKTTDYSLEKVKIEQIKKRPHVWDKYDVIDSKATCKGCKKIINISRISNAVLRLIRHLGHCP